MIEILGLLSLIILAYIDIKKRSFSLIGLTIMLIVSVIIRIFVDNYSVLEYLSIIIFSGILLGIALMARKNLGLGDVIIISYISMLAGIEKALLITWLAFVLCGVFGVIGIMLKRIGARAVLPLIPFMSISYMIMMIGERILR